MATSQLSEQKERQLVEKVELRFALADTPQKFEQSLDTFLAPLLLKLASPYAPVRQAVFNSLKDTLSRLGSLKEVKLPVQKLIQQAQEPSVPINHDSANVRLYSLLLASKGVDRIDDEDVVALTSTVIKRISKLPGTARARMFFILCKLLLKWNPPLKGSEKEEEVKGLFEPMDGDDKEFLLSKFTQFYLLTPAKTDPQSGVIPRGYTCPGLSALEVSFFTYDAGTTFSREQMIQHKKAIFNFVTSCLALSDGKLSSFLLIASTDSSNVSEAASQNLKRVSIPYEEEDFINSLIRIYAGDKKNGCPPAKHEVQEKMLTVLNRSIAATEDCSKVAIVCSIGMNSQHYKLRTLCLKFICHVAKNNYKSLISSSGKEPSNEFETSIASLIRNNLHDEGWPKLHLGAATPNFNSAILQRRLQYETLGEILKRDETLIDDLSYIEFLLASLKGDLTEFRTSIQECLTSLTINIHKLPSSSKDKLRKILRANLADDIELEAAESKELKEAIMASRMVCIKYANAAFPFEDAEARMFNVWGTARTNRFDIIEESFKGLHPYWFRINQAVNTTEYKPSKDLLASDIEETRFPSFETYTRLLLDEVQRNSKLSNASIWKTLGTAVRFSKQSLISQAVYGRKSAVIQDEDWSVRVEKAIIVEESIPLALYDMILHFEGNWFEEFLVFLCKEFTSKDLNNNQTYHSRYSDEIFGELLLMILRFCQVNILCLLDKLAPSLFQYLKSFETTQEFEMEIGANILGIISAQNKISPNINFIIESLTESEEDVTQISSIVANAYILPRLNLVGNFDGNARTKLSILLNHLVHFLSIPKYKLISCKLISQICKFNLLQQLDTEIRVDFIAKVISHIQNSLLNNPVITETWGYLSMYTTNEQSFESYFDKVFETHVSKQVDYLFSAGEALSVIAGGWNSKFLSQQMDIANASFPCLQANCFGDRISYGIERLLTSCASTKPSLRKASCIWILSFIQFLGRSEMVSSKCKEIHLSFMRFLGDHDEFVQESAARGLSIIYELGNPDLKEEMVKGLLRSFTDSANAINISSGSVGTETQLFEENTLKTDDGSVRTYKDILNLASEVGDPALVYKFMSLAKSSSLWSSKKGIAFGLGAIMSKSSLQSLLLKDSATSERLIPKLFRYKFDPYPTVARSMNDIWNSLVENSNETVNKYLDIILKELLKGMANKEWRVREASTAALLQLVQTQPQETMAPHLLEIWTMAFRTMDDIKESVRDEGTKLTNALARILVSSIDVSKGANTDKSKLVLDHILPFLLGTKGLNSDAEDVRNLALKTIIDLVKNTGDAIKPFAVHLVYEFTLLFSSIEPQVINYLSLNASKYKIDADAIDVHRQNGVTTSPLFEAIDMLIKRSDETMVEQHVNSAIKATKKSVGLPSKIAATGVFNLLASRYSTSLTPFCGKLLKSCTTSFQDRNESINLAFAKSFGFLYRIATIEKAGKYANLLSEMYFQSNEVTSKKVVAAAVEAVLKQAPTQFDNVSSSFMPLLFVASNDVDKQVGSAFEWVWREASKSGSGTVRLYLEEIMELLQKNITSNNFSTRRTCSRTIVLLCENSDHSIKPKQVQKLFEITMESLKGRSWEGKEVLLDALQSLVAKFADSISSNPDLKDSISAVFVTEISRKNAVYVKRAVLPFCQFVAIFPENSLIEALIQVIESILNSQEASGECDDDTNTSTKRIKHDSDISKKSSKKNIELEEYTLKLLRLCAKVCSSPQSMDEYPLNLLKVILDEFSKLFENHDVHFTWRTQIGACDVGTAIIECFDPKISSKSELENLMKDFWDKLFQNNSTKESIENVKIQTIKFGAKLRLSIPGLRNKIEKDLGDLSAMELTSKIESELKNVGISS